MTSFGGDVNRREFVASGVAGAAGAYALTNPLLANAGVLPTRGVALPSRQVAYSPSVHFPSGVACGEVTENEITLWTQMEARKRGTWLYAEVASDKGFSTIVRRGKTWVAKDSVAASTARIRVTDGAKPNDYPDAWPWARLEPGTRYWYRFYHLKRVKIRGKWKVIEDFSSPAGRFRTAYAAPKPGEAPPDIKMAFFACQDFGTGFYNAHADMATQDVDLVVALGDYIYESAYFEGGVRGVQSTVDGQVRTLDEYRKQYRWYTADKNLQAVRAMAPMTIIWDDHEVADNYAGELPGGYETKGLGDGAPPIRDGGPSFLERRTNAYRAFFEAQPLMPPTDNVIYGKQTTGNVDLFRLDTRQYRTDQPCNPEDAFIHFCDSQDQTLDPNATQMGAAQRQWFVNGLKNSPSGNWKIVANQVMMMSLDVVFPGLVANTDSWDGYSAERAYICDQIQGNKSTGEKKINGVSFITGDIHTFFAGNVTRTGRAPGIPYANMAQGPNVASELVVGSITSQGISDRVASLWFESDLGKWANQGNPGDQEGFANAFAGLVDPSILNWNPHMRYANTAYKGYGLMTISGDTMKMKFRATHNPKVDGSGPFTLASFTVDRIENEVHRDAVAADRRTPLPIEKNINFTKNDVPGAVMDFIANH